MSSGSSLLNRALIRLVGGHDVLLSLQSSAALKKSCCAMNLWLLVCHRYSNALFIRILDNDLTANVGISEEQMSASSCVSG